MNMPTFGQYKGDLSKGEVKIKKKKKNLGDPLAQSTIHCSIHTNGEDG